MRDDLKRNLPDYRYLSVLVSRARLMLDAGNHAAENAHITNDPTENNPIKP